MAGVANKAVVIDLTILLGKRTNPAIRCGGISYNTASMNEVEASEFLVSETKRLGLPAADPIRGGKAFESLISACLG